MLNLLEICIDMKNLKEPSSSYLMNILYLMNVLFYTNNEIKHIILNTHIYLDLYQDFFFNLMGQYYAILNTVESNQYFYHLSF